MAGSRIKGITIEIGGDTTKLQESLKKVDSSLKNTQTQLKDVNKLLKLDPSNAELLKQKQELLGKAVSDSKTRLDELNKALKEMEASPNASETIEQQNALKREIIETEHALEEYEDQLSTSNVALNVFAAKSGEVAEKTKAISTVSAGLATALVGNAIAAAGAADDLNALSQQTGFSVEELQKMQYAADVVDVSVDQMTGSIMKMTKQMESGNKTFEELGVAIYDSEGNMRDSIDVWYDSLDALSKIENETDRDAKSMEIFGKSAMSMAGVIDDGGQAMKELGEEAEDLGLILSQDMVDDANEMQDAIDKMKGRTQQAFLQMGASLAKSLVPAFDKLLNIVTKVITWFSSLNGTTQKVILVIAGLVAAISPLASMFSKVTTLAGGLSKAITFMSSPMGAVVIAIGAVVAAGVLLYKNWDTIKAKASELWSSISNTFSNIKSTISEKIDGAKQAVSNAIDKIKGLFKFEWKWPDIKLPHFRISGGAFPYGLFGQGTLPKIDIDWYAKAMKNGMILNGATIFGMQNGKLLGGGEAGSELIIGLDSLKDMLSKNQGMSINMTVNGGNVSANELADIVMDKLTTTIRRNNQRW